MVDMERNSVRWSRHIIKTTLFFFATVRERHSHVTATDFDSRPEEIGIEPDLVLEQMENQWSSVHQSAHLP